jgi:hypothetical protein
MSPSTSSIMKEAVDLMLGARTSRPHRAGDASRFHPFEKRYQGSVRAARSVRTGRPLSQRKVRPDLKRDHGPEVSEHGLIGGHPLILPLFEPKAIV